MMTHLDEQIGRILAALEKTGKAENTYIIYAGDHGLAVGSHGLLGKQNIYEHSMKTPLIVKGPGVPRGGTTNALTYLLDLFPTLLGLAKQNAPIGEIDGRDLAPVWKWTAPRVRETLFLSYGDSMRSVRDERYKLIRYPRVDVDQLFDLASDPDEMKNLAGAADQRTRVAGMMALIEQWQTRLGDQTPLRVARPEPREINMTGRAREPDPWQPMWIIEKYFKGWL
jgi:arylsulfatase A-like enzyme